jgi:hypothetical protein
MLYELMAFQRPFEHENQFELAQKICHKDPEFDMNYSEELKGTVRLMLAKEPFMRAH